MASRVYTRTGDVGRTSVGRERLSKMNPVVRLLGDMDMFMSRLGMLDAMLLERLRITSDQRAACLDVDSDACELLQVLSRRLWAARHDVSALQKYYYSLAGHVHKSLGAKPETSIRTLDAPKDDSNGSSSTLGRIFGTLYGTLFSSAEPQQQDIEGGWQPEDHGCPSPAEDEEEEESSSSTEECWSTDVDDDDYDDEDEHMYEMPSESSQSDVAIGSFQNHECVCCYCDHSRLVCSAQLQGDEILRWLETSMDSMSIHIPPLHHFVCPGGGDILVAEVHLCRSECRSLEIRLLDTITHPDTPDGFSVPPSVVQIQNRLSDWLFVLARFLYHSLHPETPEPVFT